MKILIVIGIIVILLAIYITGRILVFLMGHIITQQNLRHIADKVFEDLCNPAMRNFEFKLCGIDIRCNMLGDIFHKDELVKNNIELQRDKYYLSLERNKEKNPNVIHVEVTIHDRKNTIIYSRIARLNA